MLSMKHRWEREASVRRQGVATGDIDQIAINHTATNCNTLQHTATHCNTHTHYNSALAPIDKIQCCLRVKTPHLDGLVRTPLTGPRISMSTHICLESPFYTVSKNTPKSGIRFSLGSLYRFWSKRCDFRSVEQPICSRLFLRWKVLKRLHNWY